MIKNITLLLVSITMSMYGYSQNKELKGQVVDAESNLPLSSATISVNGKAQTVTDDSGFFNLDCQGEMLLKISFIGYEKIDLEVNNCSKFQKVKLQAITTLINEVGVTAALQEQKILEIPQANKRLSEEELTRNNGLYFDDAINANVPGVYMQRRGISSGQQFNIRGYGSGVGFKGANNNFDGQGYKVYLNNIPLTDAEGITVLDDIDFASIGNAEIVKGPSGSLYGLAIAGAVNLETKQAEEGEHSIQQKVMMGSYGLLRTTTQYQINNKKVSLMANYGHQESNGYMEHTASTKDFVNVIADIKINNKQSLNTYLGYSNSYDERAGELTIEQFEQGTYVGNTRYLANNAHSELQSFRGGINHNYQILPWLKNATSLFGSSVLNNSSSAAGWTDKTPLNYGLRSTLDFNFNFKNNWGLNGVAGIEAQKQNATIIGYAMSVNPNDTSGYNIKSTIKSNQLAISSTYSYFTEWTVNMPYNFSFVAGLGVSSMGIKLHNNIYDPLSTTAVNVNANYNNLVSPHFALNKVFNKKVSVYASYSKAYKAPVSSNIVLSTTGELNTGLKPEIGHQFEIGSKGNLFKNNLHYELALFNTIFKDKMTSVAVPLDSVTTGYTYIANGGTQNNKGIEVLLKYNIKFNKSAFFSSINPYANFTYSYFRYKDFAYQSLDRNSEVVNNNYDGLAVAGVSPYVFNAGVDLVSNLGLYGNVNYTFKSSMPITSDGLNNTVAYHLLNAKIGYQKRINQFGLDFYVGANNITSTKYYTMVFINQLTDAYIPGPKDINLYAGINLKYHIK